MSHWLQRIGQSDGDTFASLIAKLGNNTTAFWAAIGYEGATALANKLTAARAALLDQITALRMAELDAANIPADIDTLLARLTALRAGYLDNLSAGAVALASVLTAARGGYMDFMPRVLVVSVTAAANAGITIVATVATQPVVIDSIVLHANAAQTVDLTSAAVQGGVGQVVTFISAAEAAAANLNAADKQVGWVGAVRLAVGKTIVVNLQGTGATAVNLAIIITYHAEVAGGVLS